MLPRGLKNLLGSAVFAAALFAVPAGAAAVDRYAEPGGNGPAATCPESDPCDIFTAISNIAVQDGDNVFLLAGPYSAGVELTINDDIVVEPKPGVATPVLNTSAATGFSVENAGAVLRNVSIVQNSNVSGSEALNLSTPGGTVERVTATTNGGRACQVSQGTLRDSVCVLSPSAPGIGAVGPSIGGAVTRTATLRNVTAVSKAAAAPAIYVDASAGADLTLDARNVIADSLPGVDDAVAETNNDASTTAVLDLASSYFEASSDSGNGASVTAEGAGDNIEDPPEYVSFSTNDFHQLPTSPTVDKGTVDLELGAFDLDGGPRIFGALPDIGADEIAPPVPPVLPTTPGTPVVSTPPAARKKCKKKRKLKRGKCVKRKKKKKK